MSRKDYKKHINTPFIIPEHTVLPTIHSPSPVNPSSLIRTRISSVHQINREKNMTEDAIDVNARTPNIAASSIVSVNPKETTQCHDSIAQRSV